MLLERGGPAYLLGRVAAILALGIHQAGLEEQDLSAFFTTSSQVLAAVVIAFVIEDGLWPRGGASRGRATRRVEERTVIGVALALVGLIACLIGLLVSPAADFGYRLCFGFGWGGLVASFAMLVIARGSRQVPVE